MREPLGFAAVVDNSSEIVDLVAVDNTQVLALEVLEGHLGSNWVAPRVVALDSKLVEAPDSKLEVEGPDSKLEVEAPDSKLVEAPDSKSEVEGPDSKPEVEGPD